MATSSAIWSFEGNFLPYDFSYGSVVVVDDKIHILGSYINEYGFFVMPHYLYSNSGEWIQLEDIASYSYKKGSAVVLNDKIHILGSSESGNWRYHYQCFERQDHTWVSVHLGNLPYDFYDGSAVVLNNEIHILGTDSSDTYSTKHYKYVENTDTWELLGSLPYKFRQGCAVVLNGEIHILGGKTSGYRTAHYKYANEDEGWVELSDTLPYDFYLGHAVVLNNEIHILGGYNNNTRHYKYSNEDEEWVEVSTLPYSSSAASAVVLNGELHILGGANLRTKNHYKLFFNLLPNKIVYGDNDILDLTADTITQDAFLPTVIAHGPDGRRINGSMLLTEIEPSLTSYNTLYAGSRYYKILTRNGYLYGNRPCGRNLFSTSGTASRTTSWTPVEFTSSVYEADGSSYGVMLDPFFGHIDANGDIVVDRAIPTAYIHGCAFRGVTSSGTAVYSGIRLLKNGTVIQSLYGSSSTTSPSCRRIETSFAVGDVIQIQTRCSTTTQGYARCEMGITWAGT